jgi:surface protein
MKTIHTYITEKLKIRKTNNTPVFYITDADSLEKYVNEHFNKDTKHLDLRNISFERCEDINKQRLSSITMHKYIGYFCAAYKVETIDVSNWKFGKYESLYELFESCWRLTEIIGLDTWDLSYIKTVERMFAGCTMLTDLQDISDWNLSSCISFTQMFDNCKSLTTLDLSNWTIPDKFYHIGKMFARCFNLKELKGIENWNVEHVTWLEGVFAGCCNLQNLDLTNWKPKPRSTTRMFANCTKLTTIGDISNWDFSDNINTTDMFNGCEHLVLDMSMIKLNISVSKVRMFKNANPKIKKPKLNK